MQAWPGWRILWSSCELTQMLAGSTYHSSERISSWELFWGWCRGMNTPPASTMAASHKRQAPPVGTRLKEPGALVWEGRHNFTAQTQPGKAALQGQSWVGPQKKMVSRQVTG